MPASSGKAEELEKVDEAEKVKPAVVKPAEKVEKVEPAVLKPAEKAVEDDEFDDEEEEAMLKATLEAEQLFSSQGAPQKEEDE